MYIKLNGQAVEVVGPPSDASLLWVLRDHLHLNGTKFGCGVGLCGACTVHLNGVAIRSCVTTLDSVAGQEITTIEGLSPNGDHPLQQAWITEQVAQCGYCQPGQIMQAASLLKKTPHPTDEEINAEMDGNLCRCATYLRIKRAIKRASAAA